MQFFIQVFDDCALSQPVKDELYKCYPNAKRAHLKKGGNFPYLCRSADVNLYLQVCVFISCNSLPPFAFIRDDRNQNTRTKCFQDFRQSKFVMTFGVSDHEV